MSIPTHSDGNCRRIILQKRKASQTADGVAFRRTAHQVLDIPPVFRDGLVIKILGPDTVQRIADHAARLHPMSRALRAFVSARSRYAEEKLAYGVSNGVTQYVLLGAGLDTLRSEILILTFRSLKLIIWQRQQWKKELLNYLHP
jgi:O-methyltransferase involved in polyketide biosynthesis